MATQKQTDFVKTVYPAAEKLRLTETQIAHPLFITAQAALETGWNIRQDNNLFGIKAGASWKGKTATYMTREYLNGEWVKIPQVFRVYNSMTDALRDHQAVLKLKGYADAWPSKDDPHRFAEKIVDEVGSKYATDPDYAKKIKQIIDKVYKIVLNEKL